MKFRGICGAALAVAAVWASPAAAKTFSLAGNFGNPVFQYGQVAANAAVTQFAVSNCSDLGVSGLCYRGTDQYQVLFQRPGNTSLLVHPGPGAGQNSGVFFTAPRSGLYTFSATFTRGDTGDGVNIYSSNSVNQNLVYLATVNGASPTYTYAGSQFLTRGTQVGLSVDRGPQDYFNDSTVLTGFISGAVPEPATWAMMIFGFGLVGGAMRRRRSATPRAAIA